MYHRERIYNMFIAGNNGRYSILNVETTELMGFNTEGHRVTRARID